VTKEQAEAFLRDLTELTRKHGISIGCSGYECEGLDLEEAELDEGRGYVPDAIHFVEYLWLFRWGKP
jgi:hypothetical protein